MPRTSQLGAFEDRSHLPLREPHDRGARTAGRSDRRPHRLDRDCARGRPRADRLLHALPRNGREHELCRRHRIARARGAGFALAYPALNIQALRGVADDEQGLAAGLVGSSFQIGGAVVLAIATAVTTTHTPANTTAAQTVHGLHAGMAVPIVGAGLLALMCGATLLRNHRFPGACGDERPRAPAARSSRLKTRHSTKRKPHADHQEHARDRSRPRRLVHRRGLHRHDRRARPTARLGAAAVHFTPAPARPGTRIRTARRSGSPRASVSASAKAARSRRSAPATACSSSRARTTGTAPRRPAS